MASFRTEGVAFVTGAAKGIGQGIAYALAEAGASGVIFADVDDAGAKASATESTKFATNSKYRAEAVKLDVRDAEAVQAAIAKAASDFGRIDYLINSAGVDTEKYVPAPDNDMDDFDRVMDINMKGALLCSRAVIPVMSEQEPRTLAARTGETRDLGRGCIVNVISVLGYVAVPGKVAYVTSKHAAIGVTKSLALDVAGKGIRVNALCPGYVRTPMYEAECKKFPQAPDFIKAAVPIGRPAEPYEIGEQAVFLCSPAASYVNGIGLIGDAGTTLTVHLM